ncbi:DUF6624 domain-containing protein [Ferrimonas futtsuensis]|uniref:DUF6624 domain-containing protein n=1 Tax=Ferrimonas futtsuensis TaxID=364764 RepID=UPI00041BC891|nr:DUF6624 domain-containing protein [Ferrimonas futtsuensis]
MRILIWFLAFPFAAIADVDVQLQAELMAMKEQDQQLRQEVGRAGWQHAPKAILEQLSRIDKENSDRLEAIAQELGWPTKSLVGEDGVGAAFLIVQHSPNLAFKKRMLASITTSYRNGDGISGQEVALLTDRILVAKGEKQRFGTQAELTDGKVILYPIEDEANVDKRRSEMNMPPLKDYMRLMEQAYGIKDPADAK